MNESGFLPFKPGSLDEKWARVSAELLQADDFRDNFYFAVLNQCGHFAIIGAALGFALVFLLGSLASSIRAIACIAALLYFITWEYGLQGINNLTDAVTDTAFVTLGAAFAAATRACKTQALIIWLTACTLLIWVAYRLA